MGKLCGLLLTGFLIIVSAPSTRSLGQTRGTGTISGKVTTGGKPTKGITVTATATGSIFASSFPPKSFSGRAVSDEQGVYHITGLSAGTYKISPFDPANYLAGRSQWESPGKDLTLDADESADDIDFDIARGGVITGRITNAEGKPLVEMQVSLEPLDSKVVLQQRFGSSMYRTDDRGVYRIYGLPAGQYLVSVGEDKSGDTMMFGMEKKGFYPKTFYPGATEKSQAKTVELAEGSEDKNIDITIAPREMNFSITGRVVDEATGKPVPSVQVGYGKLSEDGRSIGSSGMSSSMVSDAAGEFRLDGVKPGHYAVFVGPNYMAVSDAERTSSPVLVDIADADVTDVELKTRPGISLDGIVVIEGNADPRIAERLTQLSVYCAGKPNGTLRTPNFRIAKISVDHSFHIGGLSPGTAMLNLMGSDTTKGFSIRRVEQNGIASSGNTVELADGSGPTNVRLILAYGNGTIRGQVVMPADLPQGLNAWANALEAGQPTSFRPAQVDARGRFVIEGLSPGEYTVTVRMFSSLPGSAVTYSGSQKVTVAEGGEATVSITVVPNPPRSGGDRP